MTEQALRHKIEQILKELNSCAGQLAVADEPNLGLLSANAHYLYEHVNVLRKLLADRPAQVITAPEAMPVPEKQLVEEAKVEEATEKQPEHTEPVKPVLTEAVPPKKVLTEEIKVQGINERFKKEGNTLNERIAKPAEKNIAGHLNHRPVYDLKTAIGINDKFLFINELFKGDKEYYQSVIDKLASFESFAAANDFLKESCAVKFEWEKKQDLVDRFYAILNRKFNV